MNLVNALGPAPLGRGRVGPARGPAVERSEASIPTTCSERARPKASRCSLHGFRERKHLFTSSRDFWNLYNINMRTGMETSRIIFLALHSSRSCSVIQLILHHLFILDEVRRFFFFLKSCSVMEAHRSPRYSYNGSTQFLQLKRWVGTTSRDHKTEGLGSNPSGTATKIKNFRFCIIFGKD